MTREDTRRLREDALDVLTAAAPDPLPTPEIADRLGLNRFEAAAHLYPQLRALERHGWVERVPLPRSEWRAVFWRTVG